MVIEINETNVKNYFQTNQYSLKRGVGYIELDLFPDINSLKCIGKSVDTFLSSTTYLEIFATSSSLYKLISFIYPLILFSLFIFFKEKNIFLLTFLLIQNYLTISFFFFKSNVFNFQLFIYIFVLILYKNSSKNNFRECLFEIVFALTVNLLLFNYDLYSKLQIILIFLLFKYFKDIKLTKNHIKVLTYAPITYYLLRQVSGPINVFGELWESLSSGMYRGPARFADMFYAYGVIYCNKNNCDTTNNYGPLFEIISFNLNIKFFTFITSLGIILIAQFYYYKIMKELNKNYFIVFLIYTCGPITFLIERMNFDIVVIIFSYLAIYIYEKNYKTVSLFILSLLTLIKVFPIIFIIGIIVYEVKNEDKKQIILNTILAVSLSIAYVYYYTNDIQSGFTPNPYGITWTFGILSDFQNYRNYLGLFAFAPYVLIGSSIFIIKKVNKYRKTLILNSNDQLLEFCFLITFLAISFYYNFDYRLGFLILPTILLVKNYGINSLTFCSTIFLCTSVSPFLIVENISSNIFSFMISFIYILINHLSFYILIFYITLTVFNYLKIEFKKLSLGRKYYML